MESTLEADIVATRRRLADAERQRHGHHRQYLASCSAIYALVQELEQLESSRGPGTAGA